MKTFRVRGHEEASGTKYVPGELQKEWALRDPIDNYERYLIDNQLITQEYIDSFKKSFKAEVSKAADLAFDEPTIESTVEKELADVYVPSIPFPKESGFPASTVFDLKNSDSNVSNIRFVDAISKGLYQAMERHDNLVLMGQDIAEYGGVFKITDGFVKAFGKERVRNTPLCESAIVGCALGLSMMGMKAMVEMQFADFVTCGFNQIINNLAKLNYRWGQNADVVIRMPCGGGVGAGPFHSQSNEAWFTHTPGLKVVYPSNPVDAKGLLLAAFEDPNPIMFFEHKALYRSLQADVPDDYYIIEIGKAAVARAGEAMSIITYGAGVHWALKATEELGIDAEIIDLRTLAPLDYEAIENSIKKTNKALILHEDTMFGGLGGEISAWISEYLFEHLDAPVLRVASLDMPIPFSPVLEKIFMPEERLRESMLKLMRY
jgi:2-oxoisovalerate dehydrogenase E1 component